MIAMVVVVPKPVINDPQGTTVKQGLRALGFDEVADVRVGKYIELTLDTASPDEASNRVEKMCRQLLANQVIEDFRVELVNDSPRSRLRGGTGDGVEAPA